MLVLKDTAHCAFVTRNVVGTLAKVSSFFLIGSYLKIDNRWLKDIQLIEESNYSKVSKEYKEEVLYQGVYELSDEPIIDYIYIKNIPAKILNKHESLLTAINEIFKTSYELHQVDNLFDEFNIKKETYKWNL